MNIQTVWSDFLSRFNQSSNALRCERKVLAGASFLYIRKYDLKPTIENDIKIHSMKSMENYRLHSETIFVRETDIHYVFRHRFFVPQEKMFCCGNLCEDCIRFRS
ncbi:hypothetical protein Q73_04970 [Bacillus coahuilensis m2-6]|uniref:hypothetical protein n=1 Tax=Bacillus coahuilensis TaxID=408580 RepID=UPI00018514FB|nr:hypothetical protein [Bacillus coahuilensis]KUP08548.1 hypothetical protein Q73_04970 [Bacillus coahuilensis m2-6]